MTAGVGRAWQPLTVAFLGTRDDVGHSVGVDGLGLSGAVGGQAAYPGVRRGGRIFLCARQGSGRGSGGEGRGVYPMRVLLQPTCRRDGGYAETGARRRNGRSGRGVETPPVRPSPSGNGAADPHRPTDRRSHGRPSGNPVRVTPPVRHGRGCGRSVHVRAAFPGVAALPPLSSQVDASRLSALTLGRIRILRPRGPP